MTPSQGFIASAGVDTKGIYATWFARTRRRLVTRETKGAGNAVICSYSLRQLRDKVISATWFARVVGNERGT